MWRSSFLIWKIHSSPTVSFYPIKSNAVGEGASLVVQRIRICLPVQGTRFRSLIWEDPTRRGTAKPVDYSHWASALELGSCSYWALFGNCCSLWASPVARLAKNRPAMRETWVQSLGWEDPLDKGKAIYSSILAWRIPRTVQSMGSQRVGHDWATFTSLHWRLHTLEPGLRQHAILICLCLWS